MAFKDALKDITEMFGSPEVQTIVSALGQSRKAPGGRVAENLSVPFGLTFEQGSALRGEAQTADAYTDARQAQQRAADAEAQRVALEGRRVAEGEKAGAHERSVNTLTDAEELQRTTDNRMNEIVTDASFRQAEGEAQRGGRLDEIDATYANQLINDQELDQSRENSASGQADLAYVQAQTEYLIAQSVFEEVNRGIGQLSAHSRGRAAMGALNEEDTYRWVDMVRQVRTEGLATYGPGPEVEAILNREAVNIYSVAYDIGAVPVSVFRPHLSPDDYAEFERLDEIWRRARDTGDLTEYKLEQAKILDDLIDDQRLNQSSGGGRPTPGSIFGGGAPMRPGGQVEAAPQKGGETIPAPAAPAATTEPYVLPGQPPGAEPARKPINMTGSAFELQLREKLKDAKTREDLKRMLNESELPLTGHPGRMY